MFFKKSGLRKTGTDIEVLKREVKALLSSTPTKTVF